MYLKRDHHHIQYLELKNSKRRKKENPILLSIDL